MVLYGCGCIHTWDCSSTAPSVKDHTSPRPCLTELSCRNALVYVTSCCLIFLFKRLCWWEMESERPAVNSSASPRIAPVGEQRLINGVWVGDDGPLTEIHISCNGVNPGCSCLCYCLSYMILLKAGAQPCMFGPPWENRDVVWSQLSGSLLKFIFASRLHWGFQACWWPPGLIEFRRIKGITCKITQWQFPVGKAPGLRLVLGTH